MKNQNALWRRCLMLCLLMAAIGGVTVFYVWPWLGFNVPMPSLDTFTAAEPTSPAWEKARGRVEQADRQSVEAYKKRLLDLSRFFAERANGVDAFAESVLSWSGKWALLKTTIHLEDAHEKFLAEAFSRDLFTPDDLRIALESAIVGYQTDLDAIENDLLVALRADLADADLAREVSSHLRSDDAFRQEFRQIADGLRPTLEEQFHLTIGREIATFIATDIATQIVIRVGTAVATEMGISTAIVGTGAASTGVTIGVGLVVSVIIDAIIDKVLRVFGRDPELAVRWAVRNALDATELRIINGNDGAVSAHRQLLNMARSDGMSSVRNASRAAIGRIEQGGQLGLRWEMRNLHEMRLRLRHAALRKLLVEGGGL